MANEFLDARFAEITRRLALGLEPIDAGYGGRITHPVTVFAPRSLQGLPAPQVDAHDSGLRAIVHQKGLASEIELRFDDPGRYYVPRQIRYPVLTAAQAEALDYRNRVRRPVLFPGAAYDAVSLSTGVRGRVTRNGQTARWSRVEARLSGAAPGSPPIARAHGDDRGEFLLLLPPGVSAGPELTDPLPIRIDVFITPAAPVPTSPGLPELDPLWDLPTEPAAALNPADPATDPVSGGETLPPGYTATTGRTVNIPLGTILSERNAFAIP